MDDLVIKGKELLKIGFVGKNVSSVELEVSVSGILSM